MDGQKLDEKPVERKKSPALYWAGSHRPDGRPHRYFATVPARDLTDDDLDELDKDTRKAVEASDLYQKTKPSGAKE